MKIFFVSIKIYTFHFNYENNQMYKFYLNPSVLLDKTELAIFYSNLAPMFINSNYIFTK